MDDAVALTLAARLSVLGSVDVAAVTTVGGDADERAKAARVVLDEAGGAHIPVHVGRSRPFGPPPAFLLPIAPLAGGLLLPGQRPGNISTVAAVDAMYAALPATIVSIGPLSNVGELLAAYPDAVGKITQIVIMGAYPGPDQAPKCPSNGKNETYPWWLDYNLVSDAGASLATVQGAGIPIRYVPLRYTTQTWLTAADLEQLEQLSDLAVLTRALRIWGDLMTARCPSEAPIVFLHDPLTFLTAVLGPGFWSARYERVDFAYGRQDDIVFRTHWNGTHAALFPTAANVTAVRGKVMAILMNK
jgi:purine nucleosidase